MSNTEQDNLMIKFDSKLVQQPKYVYAMYFDGKLAAKR